MKKLLLITVLTLALATSAQAADFRVNPYLQNPTMDGMTVLWLSETPEPGSIEVAGVGTFPSTPLLADELAYHPDEISKHFGGVDPGTPYLHRVRVDGLSTGTTYNYTVRQLDSVFTGTMKTAPQRNSGVRFIVYADSETEPESTGKTRRCSEPYGDYDRKYWLDQTDGYAINIQVMESRNPDFIAIAGDLVESGNEQRDWDEFWKHNAGQYNDIAGSVPIFPAAGNHENHSGGDGGGGFYTTPLAKDALARYRAYFETPDNGSGKPEHQDRYYRVDYGPITYITIDSSNGSPHQTRQDTNWYLLGEGEASDDNPEWGEGEAPDFNPGSTQYQWLEEQLADAQKKSRFTFVQFHHIPYSVGPHGFNPGDGGQGNGEDTQSGVPMRVLTSLFKKYGVDAVFAGHDEMYEHSLVDGVHLFDIGIGGDGLRGPYMGEDGKFDLPSNNSYQLFLAHLDAPEIWSGNQLTDGGKHYGHLEVNVTFEDGEWRAELTPVYVFPMMDESGEVIRDISGRPLFERRIYDDVTLMDRAISDLDDDGDTDREDIAIIREHLRQPVESCPNCDIDGDGSITIRDARKIVRMCTRKRCCTEAKLLTEPFLQVPTEGSVNVVWFTEFKGSGNALVYGPDVADLMDSDEISLSQLEDYAAGGGNINIVFADTMKLSRTREDSRSNVPGRTYNKVTKRKIWRHEASATDLETAGRVPYAVISHNDCGSMAVSGRYTLAAKPTAGTSLTILLTSDHQSKPMTPANMQKVEETVGVGNVDAVFFAGDLVNVPDRASEWFDDTKGGAFFPGLQGTAGRALNQNGLTTTYSGGKIIQYAPLYTVIGNHEVMGRVKDADLNTQFNSPVPKDVAADAYEEIADHVNPSHDTEVRQQWIENNSFNVDTYLELFTLPESAVGCEKYYAETFGDVRLVSIYVTRIWKNWDTAGNRNSTYNEATENFGDPLEQGWGRHIFEPIKEGSEQYQWLKQELMSDAFQSAKYTIVMLHHPVHSLGGNVVPSLTNPVRIVEQNPEGEVTRIRYEYPKNDNYLIRDLEPLFEQAGVDLVFNGHNHVWNRFEGPTGVNYLETSNVGNTYGSFMTGRAGRSGIPGFPWIPEDYDTYDDPYGLEPIVPTVNPLHDENGPLPYISDNTITTFSILKTEDGTITTYAYDTKDPDSNVWILDRFSLN